MSEDLTAEDIEDTINGYDGLVNIAIAAAEQWRGYPLYHNVETTKLYVTEDDELVIQGWRAGSDGYDGYELDEETFAVPISFVLASAEERAAVLAERQRIAERDRRIQEAADRDRAELQREAQDRAEYERLKAKFKD